MKLSVIIPAYNEEKRLSKTLQQVQAYLRQQIYDYEIIVINDGSKDKTINIVKELSSLRLINNEENNGKGCVVRQAMLEAKGDFRLFMDADNSASIDHIEKMWPYFKQDYQVVIGSRDVRGSITSPSQSLLRKLIGKIGHFIISAICGLSDIKDTQCGFKCFTKEAAEKIFSKTMINRWGFDVEVLVIAKKLGYKIKEVPVVWRNNFQSRVNLFGIIKTLFEVFQIRLNLITKKYDL